MESFYEAVAPFWADCIEEGLTTLEDVPDELRTYVEAELNRRKGNA